MTCHLQEYVGEARAKYNPKAPLIGIAPLGVISGCERLRGVDVERCPVPEEGLIAQLGGKGSWRKYGYSEHRLPPCGYGYGEHRQPPCGDADVTRRYFEDAEKERQSAMLAGFLKNCGVEAKDRDKKGFDKKTKKFDLFLEMGKLVSKKRAERNMSCAYLDPNHSHFLLADDGGLCNYGAETQLRADIESCIAGACWSSPICIVIGIRTLWLSASCTMGTHSHFRVEGLA